jgi:hypothetical protein
MLSCYTYRFSDIDLRVVLLIVLSVVQVILPEIVERYFLIVYGCDRILVFSIKPPLPRPPPRPALFLPLIVEDYSEVTFRLLGFYRKMLGILSNTTMVAILNTD